jgi:hypothetical protein
MQFKVNENIIWEAQTWRISYVDENIIVLRPKGTKESIIKTIPELERAYMSGNVTSENAVIPELEAENHVYLSDLSLRQQRVINTRMQFIECILREGVTVDNAQEEIITLAAELDISEKETPGESTVRRWLTKYRASDCQSISLLDHRSNVRAE